jgi:hypothetical protein
MAANNRPYVAHEIAARIRNAAWWVRHSRRPTQRRNRAAAIDQLSAIVLEALQACRTSEERELVLVAFFL